MEDAADDRRCWAIIDCLMNIPLLYWASEETKDPRFKHIAMMHSRNALAHIMTRPMSIRSFTVTFSLWKHCSS